MANLSNTKKIGLGILIAVFMISGCEAMSTKIEYTGSLDNSSARVVRIDGRDITPRPLVESDLDLTHLVHVEG